MSPRSLPLPRRILLCLVGALALVAGCAEHTVGPARTYDDYERKSRTSAEVALSTVETVRLLAEAATAGNSFGTYTETSISEQEDTLAGAQGDFGSIQPPDARSDALRVTLNKILGTTLDDIAAVRIAARRGVDQLEQIAAPLADDSKALSDFLDAIS